MKITQDVREYAATHGIAEETAAIAQGLREKAKEFRKSGGARARSRFRTWEKRGNIRHPEGSTRARS